ncbi:MULTISPECIES: shikimate dehydrogenase [unclassified Francisella]|uniref:shikimate dehydrogenase n=1 Tax=unclassified Francisella TaxID=2610885 RepID=UPI002E364815|nr:MULTISPECIES: shikimate dehydrogenase [unclassified Francisella]MED7819164.1 shikimate dehydrogenase [Francisella sp. 19S2-4]MED7830363.1 shikimate dehydrogenase [Francisella sp. 19S2-10]
MSDLYHVIGFPVKHSLSPKIQMELARQYSQDMIFTAIEVKPEELEEKIKEFKNNTEVKGLSVTIPHKERVFALADDSDTTAKAVGAASNVIFTPERKMIALNYDGLGIVNDIKNNYKVELKQKKVLVVGAGGAAKAVVAAIIKESPKSIAIANRTMQKAQAIANLFVSEFAIDIEDFTNISGTFDIVINSTSSSIHQEMLPLKTTNFTENAFAYDLMYADVGTIFTKWCQENHIFAADGKGMLQELSKAVFKYWRGL